MDMTRGKVCLPACLPACFVVDIVVTFDPTLMIRLQLYFKTFNDSKTIFCNTYFDASFFKQFEATDDIEVCCIPLKVVDISQVGWLPDVGMFSLSDSNRHFQRTYLNRKLQNRLRLLQVRTHLQLSLPERYFILNSFPFLLAERFCFVQEYARSFKSSTPLLNGRRLNSGNEYCKSDSLQPRQVCYSKQDCPNSIEFEARSFYNVLSRSSFNCCSRIDCPFFQLSQQCRRNFIHNFI